MLPLPLFKNTPSALLRKAYPPGYLSEVPHAGAGSFAPHAGDGSFAPQAGAGSFVPHAEPSTSFAVIVSPPFRFTDLDRQQNHSILPKLNPDSYKSISL